ncbi:class I SAM-dependent methyltransferase [Halochromatium roseum]|uniref:class I SAM-dependent methyltransferase n=1 Tax=Halochromatium roseum TaxID=391920 RepID=UPI001911A562|nr:methyltransferase domain-containing protein [Halochromatium roseum]MBK5937894.1 methyltransferase [Halochromatium roseum]
MDIKELAILGRDVESHWYYSAKAAAMERMLGSRRASSIVDVGAGSGFFSQYLLRRGQGHEAWCIDTGYRSDLEEVVAGKTVHYRRRMDFNAGDLVLMMDVLEHVDNDIALLQWYVKRLSAGTRFLISVPAFGFLWSGHDIFLEHKRRYGLKQLESVVKAAGLEIERSAFFFASVFPIAAATRAAQRLTSKVERQPRSQLKQHSPFLNTILAGICAAELPFFQINRAFGLTIFCLAVKR